MTNNAIISAITAVLSQIGTWFTGSMESISSVFYGTDGLTFFGVLAICGLGVSVALLILNIIKGFLNFR